MFKKLIKILCISAIIVIFGCMSAQQNVLPAKEGQGYSLCKEAPTWMAKDCIAGGYGLMDGVEFEDQMIMYWAIKMDTPDDPEGLDGKCDVVAILQDSGQTAERNGYIAPTVHVVGKMGCESWDELKDRLPKKTKI